MADLNKCIFTGRIGNDIELKSTSSGVSTCSFRLAVERPKAKNAQEAETDWLDMVAWRNTAEFCSRYLTKGRKVTVECVVRTRKWNDRDGNPRKAVEFHIENIYPADSKPNQNTGNAPAQYAAPSPQAGGFDGLSSDEDMPF